MKPYDFVIDYNFVNSFDINLLKKSLVLPIKKDGIYIECFCCKSSNTSFLEADNIVKKVTLKKEEVEFFLNDTSLRQTLFNLSKKAIETNELESNYIEEFFSNLIEKAIVSRVSDIHIESYDKNCVIRFRIDGSLKIFYIFEKSFLKVLSSHIKMVSKLEVTQNRVPMDGRFTFQIKEKKFDFRVSTMPTINGESIVIRVLDSSNISKDIEDLGFSSHILDSIKDITKLKQGLVLVTGPTGSGKSTTLYSLIKELNKEDRKIITVEDPVEYKLQQIQQIEVNDEINLGFNTVLKNILRQDPDVILIGEIRDFVSLSIALQASLTGHLVLASIHANNSIETISRLVDLKADKFLLATTLKYIISQRLVLNICKDCNCKGCDKCNFSGYYGRSCIAEVLKIDDIIIKKVFNNENLEDYLKKLNYKTIVDDAKQKVENKVTTLREVYKVIEI